MSVTTRYELHPAWAADTLKDTTHKVLHLVRHAQGASRAAAPAARVLLVAYCPPVSPTLRARAGTHNLAVSSSGSEEEYKSEKWADARLTATGIGQAERLQPTFVGTPVEVCLVSPLSRTIQTALHGIPTAPRFVATELVRERNGTHPCDRRRTRAELAADFPLVDFSLLESEADTLWTPEREPLPDLASRARAFLDFVSARPETHIAVVTHHDFLESLFFDSGLALMDGSLRKHFHNAEHLPTLLVARPAAASAADVAASASAASTVAAPSAEAHSFESTATSAASVHDGGAAPAHTAAPAAAAAVTA